MRSKGKKGREEEQGEGSVGFAEVVTITRDSVQ